MSSLGLIALVGLTTPYTSGQDDITKRFEVAENERKMCRASLTTYANAEMAYRVKTRKAFTANLSDLDEFTGRPLTCPNGGKYNIVVGVPTNSFTVHCSVLRHDAGHVQPSGFSPRVNSDSDIFSRLDQFHPSQPPRVRCRAKMAMISDEQVNHMLENGRFTTDVEKLFGIPINCPDQGNYTISLGKPTHAFTVHCSVAEHDAGLVEPRGYSPGLNSQ